MAQTAANLGMFVDRYKDCDKVDRENIKKVETPMFLSLGV